MNRFAVLAPTLALALLWAPSVPAADSAADDLAPGGTLRATFLAGNPVQGRADPATGATAGPAPDLARELARRAGLPFRITPLQGVRAVIDSVKSGAADIGFLAFDPARAAEVDFTQTYSLAHNTYLVRADSPIRAPADIDRPGIRIGVGQGDAGHLYLERNLKQAALKPNPGGALPTALRQLAAGEIDAYAANRQRLSEVAGPASGTRMLDENFLGVEQCIVVPKGNAARLALLDRFIDEMRDSGFIQRAIAAAKLNGVDVAPKRAR